MKALQVTSFRQFDEVEHPNPQPKEGYAIVKVAYGAICGSDRIPRPTAPDMNSAAIYMIPALRGSKKETGYAPRR